MKEDIDTKVDTSEDLVNVYCNGVEGRYAEWMKQVFCMCEVCLGSGCFKPKKWVDHVLGSGHWKDV